MNLAIVKGSAVCTVKYPGTEGIKLLVVQPVNKHLEPIGGLVVAADSVRAGIGDTVLVLREGSGARQVLENEFACVISVVIGIVDSVKLDG